LFQQYPSSTRVRDAKLLWATSAIALGQSSKVPDFLRDLNNDRDPDSLLLTAKAFEASGNTVEANNYYRRTYFFGAGSQAAKDAETKLTASGQVLTPQNAEEAQMRADKLYAARRYQDAALAYNNLFLSFPTTATPQSQLRRIASLANSGKMTEAQSAFNTLLTTSKEREEGYRQLVLGYARAKQWPQARSTADEMRAKFPNGSLVPKTFIDAGLAA